MKSEGYARVSGVSACVHASVYAHETGAAKGRGGEDTGGGGGQGGRRDRHGCYWCEAKSAESHKIRYEREIRLQ